MLTRIPYVVRSIDFLALRFSSNRQLLAIVRTMVCVSMLIGSVRGQTPEVDQAFIDRQLLVDYVDYFNRMEPETVQQAIPNAAAQAWLAENIPLFDCPQDNVREIYYFRWWSLRKHLRETPVGFGFTEFLVPRSYADKYNLISCALGHHVMETRWLRNRRSIDDCLHVWFRGNDGQPMARLHKFSSWAPYAVWQKYLVDGNEKFAIDLLPDLIREDEYWERENLRPDGLFWQYDVRDGMEEQISGSRTEKNARPTINSYMAGNAAAIANIAELAGRSDMALKFRDKATSRTQLVRDRLWNRKANFFEALRENQQFAEVREQIGYVPWYFQLATAEHDSAWQFASDEKGFLAPYGLTTAERSHPQFRSHGCCNCEWDGAVWPFATSQTLTGMANRLHAGPCDFLNREQYFRHFELYVESQYHRGRPYIGEYLDETTGHWLKGDQERSRYYNHSTFADLLITGLIGLCPRQGGLTVDPLVPADKWDWFCLDGVAYQGHVVCVMWDKDGSHYHRGPGLTIFIDGLEKAHRDRIARVDIEWE